MRTRERADRLVRSAAELRPRDAALERGGRVLDHAMVLASAERVAGVVKLAPHGLVLVSAPAAEQAVGWGAVFAAWSYAVGGPELLAEQHPDVWVCTPAQLDAFGLGRARVGALSGLVRSVDALGLSPRIDRDAERLGSRLTRILVVGAVPPSAEGFRQRGVEVGAWTA